MPENETVHPTPQARARPPAGMPVIVDVFARTSADGGVVFTHQWRWEDGTPGGNGSIGIPPRDENESGTPMHFHLRDETVPRRGLDFTDDADGAMWVLRSSCPPAHQKSEDPELPMHRMVRSPNLLRVFNENAEKCTLHYRLRFKDRNGTPESYDPDILNGGTNRA